MYGLSARMKKSGHCREVAVSGCSTVQQSMGRRNFFNLGRNGLERRVGQKTD